MKNALFTILLFLSAFVSYGQLETAFVASCEFSGFTQLTDSTFRGNVISFYDQNGVGALPTGIQVGFWLFDNVGNLYRVKVINSATASQANVDVVELQDDDEFPVGKGAVFDPDGLNGLILPPPANNIGVTQVSLSRISIHNILTLAQSGLYDGGTVSEIAVVPDTSALTPAQGDIFVNSSKDTLGVYNGTYWVMFFGGGIDDGDKGDITVSGGGTTWNIDASAVGDTEIADGTVGSAEIGTGAVGADELASTAVTPGSYTSPNLTIDSDGRVTSATSVTLYYQRMREDAIDMTQQPNFSFRNSLSTIDVDLRNDAGLSETYAVMTVKADGVGQVQMQDNSIGAPELISSGVTPGSYTNMNATVDSDGRITSASNGSAGATNLTFSGSSSPVTLNSSTGTDVILTAGTNVTFSQAGNNLTINSTGGGSGSGHIIQDNGVTENQRDTLDLQDNSEVDIIVTDDAGGGKTEVEISLVGNGVSLTKIEEIAAERFVGNPTGAPGNAVQFGAGYGLDWNGSVVLVDTALMATQSALQDTAAAIRADISGGGVTDHGLLSGLNDDDHPNNAYLPGRPGGQIYTAGTSSGDDFTIRSTTNATKGDVIIQDQGGDIYIGSNSATASTRFQNGTANRLGIYGSGSQSSASWNHQIAALNSGESSFQSLAIAASIVNLRATTGVHIFTPSAAPSTPTSLLTITSDSGGSSTIQEWRNGTTAIGSFSTVTGTSNLFNITSTGIGSPSGIRIQQHSNNAAGASMGFRKSRGTEAAPLAVTSGTSVGAFSFQGYSGTQYLEDNALFGGAITGTVSASSVPTSLFFISGSASASYNPDLLIHHSGRVGIGNGFGSIITSITSPFAKLHVIGEGNTSSTWICQFHNSTGTNNALMVRDDGKIAIGTATPDADAILTVASAPQTVLGTNVFESDASMTGKDGWIMQYNETAGELQVTDYTKQYCTLNEPAAPNDTFNLSTSFKILDNVDADFAGDFAVSGGVVTYSGRTNYFLVSLSATVSLNGGDKDIFLSVFKNNTTETECNGLTYTETADKKYTVSGTTVVQLADTNTLRLKAKVDSGTPLMTIHQLGVSITEI